MKENTTNFEGWLKFKENGLLHEDLLAFDAEGLNLTLEKVDLFDYFGSANWEQLINDVIDVDFKFSFDFFHEWGFCDIWNVW